MSAKQAKELIKLIKGDHCYEIGYGLVAFYTLNEKHIPCEKETAKLLSKAVKLEHKLTTEEWQELLKNTAVFYHSQSRSKGITAWMSAPDMLSLYFGETALQDEVNYYHLMDAICYQQNVAAKCVRISSSLNLLGNNEEDPTLKGLCYFMAALLRKAAHFAIENNNYIYTHIGTEKLTAFNFWYEQNRNMIKNRPLQKGEVHRLDAFFKKTWFFPKKIYTGKYIEEKQRAIDAINHIKVILYGDSTSL